MLYEEVGTKIRSMYVKFSDHIVELSTINENADEEEGRHYRTRNYYIEDPNDDPNDELKEIKNYKIVTWLRVGTPLRTPGGGYKTTINGGMLDSFFKDFDSKSYDEEEDLECAVYFITESGGSLRLNEVSLNTDTYKDDIIDDNYNDCFRPAYDKMVSFVKSEESGLVLLSGLPGTGKSSLIVHYF